MKQLEPNGPQNLSHYKLDELTKLGYSQVTGGTFQDGDLVKIEDEEKSSGRSIFAKLSKASYLLNRLCKIVIGPESKVFRIKKKL